jgi:GWxTD domain-containing protein
MKKFGIVIILILLFGTISAFSQWGIQISEMGIIDTMNTFESIKEEFNFTDLIKEGNFLLEQKLYDDAIKKYEEANKIKETSNAYKGIGLAYIQKAKALDEEMVTPIKAVRKRNYCNLSVENFLKASNIESNNLEIKYLLSDAYVFMNKRESYEKAVPVLEQIISTDKNYKDALILLSIVYRRLNKSKDAEKVINEYLKMNEFNSRALYQLSKLALERDEFENAEKFFLQSLDNLTDSDAISEILEDIEILFSAQDQYEFKLAEHKGKFFKKFWLSKDPDPKTESNERLIEHFKRVKFANKNFTTQSTHGSYDDRGRTYIKYGEPDGKFLDGGGVNTYSNEYWEYFWGVMDYNYGFVFNFANKGGWGYELIGDSSIASLEAGFGLFKGLKPQRREMGDAQYKRLPEGLADKFLDYRDAEEFMYLNVPAEGYPFFKETKPLYVMTSSASFKGENGGIRQELYYSFPINEIKFKKSGNNKTAEFDEYVVMKNVDNKNFYQNDQKIELKYDKNKDFDDEFYIGQINIDVPYKDEDYTSFLRITSSKSDKLGLVFHDFTERDYSGDSLSISEIEFAYNIEPTTEEDQFTKNGLRIIPHTGAVLDKNENIFIYFEIYNLSLDERSEGRYNIELIIQKRNPEDTTKKKFYNEIGKEISNKTDKFFKYFVEDFDKESITISRIETVKQKDTFIWFSLDMKALSDGLYDLTIKITDLVLNQSSSSEYAFMLGKK